MRGRTFDMKPVLLVIMGSSTEYNNIVKKISQWLVIFLAITSFVACQEEESLIKLPPDDAAITVESPVAQLLLRVVTLDGSSDNILDQSSCLTIVLPVTVIVDDETIVVTSPADFDLVEDALDDDDDGEVAFIFPIEVILPDYSRVTVTSQSQLSSLIENCEDQDDIECIDIKYPISIKLYDTNNQVSDVITITSDESLYNFLRQLSKNTYISIQFPVTLINSDGAELVVGNYDELETAILLSEDDCDDDDGTDFEFVQILTAGNWIVDSFIDEGDDQTNDWANYVLKFNADGSLTASNGNTELSGTWHADTDDGELELTIQLIAGNPFDDINEDWTVKQYDSSLIKLEDEDDQEPGELKTLTLKKI